MNQTLLIVLAAALGAGAGAAILHLVSRAVRSGRLAAAGQSARSILERAEADAAARAEALLLEARVKAEAAEARMEEEAQQKAREAEELKLEVERRDRDVKRRMAYADERIAEVEKREAALGASQAEAARCLAEAQALLAQQRSRLEQIAGYSAAEARGELRREIELDARRDAAATILRVQEEARERAAEEARWVTAQAIQRLPLSQYAETTVTVVRLPSDEMKGRIIGREGRNIRSLEMACGIDLIIDDTPGAIILSSFDPSRRMVAKLVIERLVEDGRIHPARIEEMVAKVREELDKVTQEQGEAAAFELGLHDLNARLFRLAGRLGHLTHHGQSLLEHSREVALLGAAMAALIGARAEVVKRAGFLHKIGFADDAALDRSPQSLSADLLQRLGEPEPVVHCVQSLYGLAAPRTVEAVLLQAAEQASIARPGGQKPMLGDFLEQLGRLEAIALSFPGVREAYAVRAGKEVRVIVSADQVSDKEAVWLSKDIAARIEKEVDYPGQLRISVIRETRSVGFAM
ncbi:MAG TPA: ribonuclease Y [Candidatus Polarisedimenticolia bacterium]|nr:ribonuclease Y [Candidatus Polarisedimenticolia bacterium]